MMAFPKVEHVPTKLSFAKIAAMPAPNVQPALPNTLKDNRTKSLSNDQPEARMETKKDPGAVPHTPVVQRNEPILAADMVGVQAAMKQTVIADNESNDATSLQDGINGESCGDAHSIVSTSSLKQQSFDTKSIASVTTFGMDEKESIRPDDSASVRAVEDDDSNPGISRHSSFQHDTEVTLPTQRAASKTIVPSVSMVARRYPGLVLTNPPRFGDLPISPISDSRAQEVELVEPGVPVTRVDGTTITGHTMTPDDKLIEALASPKDRLPLLQLEEKIVTFITYGRDDTLELPPQNSFTRLLAHKLADYYSLDHQVTEDNSSVRIYRTTPTSLPVSLADIAKSIHAGPHSLSTATQVKIMRRVQLGRQMSAGTSTAASSSVPSKATSENGGDFNSEEGLQSPYDGTPGREKPRSREEREAQYKAVRDRIFGDFQESVTSESGSTGETSASISRSSSTSGGKKKSRKSKTPKDDTFTRRSEFVAYGPMHMQQQSLSPTYNDSRYQDPYQTHSQPGCHPQNYGQNPMQQYAPYDQNLAYGGTSGYATNNNQMYPLTDAWNHMQPPAAGAMYSMPAMQPFAQQTQLPMHTKEQYPQAMQAVPQSPGWSQPQFTGAPLQAPLPTNNTAQWPNYSSPMGLPAQDYQYASNHRQMYGNDTSFSGQQPVLSALNGSRSLFNPQTRSFVPNNASGRGGNRGRKKGGPNESMAKSKEGLMAGSQFAMAHGDGNMPRYREDSLQQKYGTPANLPKKPPPSQVSPHFAGDNATQSANTLSGTLGK